MKHLVIGQRQKAPNYSAFLWSLHGSLVSIGLHFVTTNINTENKIGADLNTESGQAMRAVHSCIVLLFIDDRFYAILCHNLTSGTFAMTQRQSKVTTAYQFVHLLVTSVIRIYVLILSCIFDGRIVV